MSDDELYDLLPGGSELFEVDGADCVAYARAIEAATLERAAQVADDMDHGPDGSIAKAIRALKEQTK